MRKVLLFLLVATLLAFTSVISPNLALAADLSVTIDTVDQNGQHIPGYIRPYGQDWQASPHIMTLPDGAATIFTAYAGFRTVEQIVTILDDAILTIDATDTSVTQASSSGAGRGLSQINFQFLPLSVVTNTVDGSQQHLEGWVRTAYYADWHATPHTFTPQNSPPDLIVNGGTVSFEAMAVSTTITRTVLVWQDTAYTVGDETTISPGPGPGVATIDFVFTVLTVYLDTVDQNGQHIDGFIQKYGQDWQATPATVTMPKGASTIFTSFSGYRTVEQIITIQEDTIYTIDATGASVSMTTGSGAGSGAAQVIFTFFPLSVACDTLDVAEQHADGFIRPAAYAPWQVTPYIYTPQHRHPELIVNGGAVPFEALAFSSTVTQTITVWEDTAYTVQDGVTEKPGAGAGTATVDFIFSTLTLTIDTVDQNSQHIGGYVQIYGQDWQAAPFTLTIPAGATSVFTGYAGYRLAEQIVTLTEGNIYIIDATDVTVTQTVQSGAGAGAARIIFKFLPLSITCDTLDGNLQHVENGEVWISAFSIYHFTPYTYEPTNSKPELIVNGGTVTFDFFAAFKTVTKTITIWQDTAYTVNGEITSGPGPGPGAATIDCLFHFLSVTFDTVNQNGQHIEGLFQLADQGWHSTPCVMELPDGIMNRFLGFAGYRTEENILTINEDMIYTIDATDSRVVQTQTPGAGSGTARVVFQFFPLTLTLDTVDQAGRHIDGFVQINPAADWQNSPHTYVPQDRPFVVNGATTYCEAYSDYASGGMGLTFWDETIYTVDLISGVPILTTGPGLGEGLAALNFIVAEQTGDVTPPLVTIESPEARPYLHSDTVSVSFTATDPESGIDSVTAILDGEKALSNGDILNLFQLKLGEHTLVVTAWNREGDSASALVAFEVEATIDTLIEATNVCYKKGLIDSQWIWLSLRAKAVLAKKLIDYRYYSLAKICLFSYIKEVKLYQGTHIRPQAADYLIAEARYIIQQLPDDPLATINLMIFAVKIGYQMDLISSQPLADALIAKLNMAGYQIAAGYLEAAKETLKKFISQVKNANGAIHPDLANLLIQGARYIIDHLDPAQAAPILSEGENYPDFLKSETWIQSVPEITKTRLGQNYPNPLNPETWIPFELAQEAEVNIRIYNLSGELIRTLKLGKLGSGSYTSKGVSAYWDGKDSDGSEVASGIYLYQLIAGSSVETRKMVVLK
ncbi:MAG: FlgD immunoglobulin-like domain containing protein [bacterium]